MTSPETVRAQRRLGLLPTGLESPEMETVIRAFQKERGLRVTGRLDEPTEAALSGLPTAGLLPSWYGTEATLSTVVRRLGAADADTVLRFQSAAGLPLTGEIDEQTAIALGD